MFKGRLLYLILFLIAIRIYLGEVVGVWFPSDQVYDDALMINYSLVAHYTHADHMSLLKTMSYPWFLDIIYVLGIRYTFALSFLWSISALLVFSLAYKITKNRLFSLFFFIYFLFMPPGFELWMGTRVYRNSIIAPFVTLNFLYFIYSVYTLLGEYIHIRRLMLASFLFSMVFTFTYYIKEDGIWLMLCLSVVITVNVFILIYRLKIIKNLVLNRNNSILLLFSLFLPLLIFVSGTYAYKYVNYSTYGVFEIETRTQGELGGFAKRIYKISSNNRNGVYWAPKDAIEKAFEVSPTLEKYPQLKEAIIHTPWFGGDISLNPIKGDFLTWVLRTALVDSKVWVSEKQVSELFQQINAELDQAFINNELKKDSRLQIISSAGGRSSKEILGLFHIIKEAYKGTILLEGYNQEKTVGNLVNIQIAEKAAKLTSLEYLSDYSKYKNYLFNEKLSSKVVNTIFTLYRILNSILAIFTVSVIMYLVIKLIMSFSLMKSFKPIFLPFCFMLSIMGISFFYVLGIAWFSEFIFIDGIDMKILNFYNIPNSIFLAFIYLFSFLILCRLYLINKGITLEK